MPTSQSGTVLKRSAGLYEARWSDSAGKRRAKMFRKSEALTNPKSAAKKFLALEVVEVSKQRRGETAPKRPDTVNALLDEFLLRHGRTVDPATERNLTTQLRKARATFGTRNPETLRKAEVEDWRLELPAGSRHGVFRAFRQSLTWASERGLLEHNATTGIRNAKRKRHERAEVHPFESWTEVEAVAAELDARYRAIPIVAVGTGLRPEELYGLHRSDVDRERRVIHVQRRYTQLRLKQGCKTEASRLVPFGERVLAALDSMPPRIDTPILFPAPRGGYIDDNKFRYREWTPALKAAGIPHRRINDCRHTYISWSLAAGVPVGKLSKMAGTSIIQIEDTYSRFLQGDEERYGSALDSFGIAV